MDSYKEPKDFDELIEMLKSMEEYDFCDCDDSGEVREVHVGGLEEGCYILYEAGEYVGCTDDVIEAAQFIAKGWVPREQDEEPDGYWDWALSGDYDELSDETVEAIRGYK